MPKQTSVSRSRDSELLAKRARQVQGGAARAAVLGINDGLVSTVCLVLGVAAASNGNQQAVMVAGFAGLVAGAFSMAAGEWISVKSQVELFEGILGDLKKMVKTDLSLLRENLESKLVEIGMTEKASKSAAQDMATKDKHFSVMYATQVLGVNPDELGSPWTAAISSLALFTLGSFVALAPWFFGGGMIAAVWSVVLTALVSLGVGAYIANTSGKSIAYGALRQFAIVLLASAVTYGIGLLFGVAVA